MFNFFKKSPLQKLEKAYRAKLQEARDAQRSGNIQLFASLTEEAEHLQGEIEKLKTAGTT